MGSPWLLLLLPLLCGGLQQEDQGYQLNLKEQVVVVQEGLCASVSCSFIIPRSYQFYPLTVYWFRGGDSHRDDPVATNDQQRQVKREALGRFRLLGNPSDHNCSLGIRRARHTDQGIYFFRVEQGNVRYNYKATMLQVLVTALTEKPAIHVAEPLVSGHPGRLTCSLPGACETTSLQFSWAGEMLGPSPPTSAELSLTPGPRDHGKNLSCQVRLLGTLRTTETTIRLHVSSSTVPPEPFASSGHHDPQDMDCEPPEQRGSWPLVLTLIRGSLMGAGYLLTYGLTWVYYSRSSMDASDASRDRPTHTGSALAGADMGFPWLLLLLLLSLLCGGLQQEDQGYQLNLKEPVLVVQEGLCASMSCSFIIPRTYQFYPLTVYWFREGDSHRDDPVATNDQQRQVKREALGRFHLLGNPSDLKCSLGIRRARHTDQGNYFFRVEQGYVKYNYKATMLRVLVTALTEKPAIHVAEPLVSGHPGRLTCSLPGACETTSLQFSWAGEMLGPSPPTSAELSLTPGPGDHGKNLSCQVILLGTLRTTETTICLNVSYPPQNLTTHISFEATSVLKIKKSTSALSVLGGQTVWLLCGADSNPPAELSWFPRSPGLKATTLSTNTAKLELRLPETTEDAEFNCHAQNPLGSRNVSLRLSVLSPLQLLGPSCSWEAQDLRCSCSSCARPAPALSWWLDQRLLPENRSNASFQVTSNTEEYWANSSLSLRKGFGAGLPVRCEARNVQERQSAWVLLQPEPRSCSCEPPEQQGSWPLVLTLIRGALMGAGYLLTYGLTWVYYSSSGLSWGVDP
ncbi:sialic acid-binding Ig-like lectin 5 [Sorex fumeus]|uniref:sialic acid-binding Ig-like lectin 5 n=1 Tax=Sorex fumeus TaxID=62283 RepID=UPI0024AE4238|nr:sialic acid-binding Ig-like lectin 5 [Sorex fumeus]